MITPKHPMQPIVFDDRGVARFKENKIVDFLASSKLNELSMMNFPKEDWNQLAQLIGYSVSGFGDLSYADPETVNEADEIVRKMVEERKK